MVELFLQDLNPQFISRPTQDLGYDLLVGFPNDKGGVNTFAVEVKPVERPPGRGFPFQRRAFDRIAHSNLPAILLVADVKHNKLYYAWLTSRNPDGGGSNTVTVPLTEVDEVTQEELKQQFKAADAGVAAAG